MHPGRLLSMFFSVISFILFLGMLFMLPHPSSAAAGTTAVVMADVVNIRAGPGTGYPIITQVYHTHRMPVLGQAGGWYNVRLVSGQSGWIAGWLVNIEEQVAAPAAPATNHHTAVVNASVLNVRNGPGTGYGVMAQVRHGERYTVLEQSGEWFKISLSNGAAGWVAGWLVNITTTPSGSPGGDETPGEDKSAVVTGSVVNVRSGPGTNNAVNGQVYQGQVLDILGQSGDWYQVQTNTGLTGWVAGWLLSVQTAPQQPPPDNDGDGGANDDGKTDNNNDEPNNGNQDGDPSNGNPDGNGGGKALSLKITNNDGKTRAVLTADAPFAVKTFYLSNPARLVVDLEGIAAGDLPDKINVNSNTVSQVRTGYYQKNPDITRLVFDLKNVALHVASQSNDKKRLTIDTYIPDVEGSYQGKVIAIDPGHGGSEPGAIGPNGTREEDVNLALGKKVQRLLEAKGAKVIMTRTGDYNVDLYERTNKANKANADIFVSIHFNANTNPSMGGTSTYIYSSNEPAQASRNEESSRLALCVQAELVKALGLRDAGIRNANFVVVRTAAAPAILVEVAFISNPSEEKLLNTESFQNKAAEAIVLGIGKYLSERE